MPEPSVVLVVGTTPDYIDWIRQGLPRKALFLTEPALRQAAAEPPPDPSEELLCDLSDEPRALQALCAHLQQHQLTLSGITCYDCEAMLLAACMARHLNLAYCSPESIGLCQNKHLSKAAWQQNNVLTPRSTRIGSETELMDFFFRIQNPCVIKPQNGTGSELVFLCATEAQCRKNYQAMEEGVLKRSGFLSGTEKPGAVAEEFIDGEEYSCDFIISDGQVRIVRVCQKILSKEKPMGTAQAYVLLPPGRFFLEKQLASVLLSATKALGISRAMCMADFIIQDNRIYLLEMTPRPGGDCLPYLLKYAWGLDTLLLNLNFACHEEINWPAPEKDRLVVGLRLHADRCGILKEIRLTTLSEDPRIKEVFIKRKPGHRIWLPPDDYDSWVLGHILFEADNNMDVAVQCQQILDQIRIHVE